ncbi:MAG: hypothetical protein U0V64_15145 [Cyclobacteriaceae bacterium]
MGQAFVVASVSCVANVVATIVISLLTQAKSREQLAGLVYEGHRPAETLGGRWFTSPVTLGVLLILITLWLNYLFF